MIEGQPKSAGDYHLLDHETLEKLPNLYSTERQGLNAIAQVKFMLSDSNWVWYGSEFDGKDIFFGLIVKSVIELDYFSLRSLQDMRGPGGERIRRDIDYQPKSLGELLIFHRKERDK